MIPGVIVGCVIPFFGGSWILAIPLGLLTAGLGSIGGLHSIKNTIYWIILNNRRCFILTQSGLPAALKDDADGSLMIEKFYQMDQIKTFVLSPEEFRILNQWISGRGTELQEQWGTLLKPASKNSEGGFELKLKYQNDALLLRDVALGAHYELSYEGGCMMIDGRLYTRETPSNISKNYKLTPTGNILVTLINHLYA